MKYFIVIVLFILLACVFSNIVGLEFIAQHIISCAIGFYIVIEIIDILISHSTYNRE